MFKYWYERSLAALIKAATCPPKTRGRMLTTVTTHPTSALSSRITSTDSSCVDYASCVVDAFSDYDDGITKTTINISVSPKCCNVPSKFARHVRELMLQNARDSCRRSTCSFGYHDAGFWHCRDFVGCRASAFLLQ